MSWLLLCVAATAGCGGSPSRSPVASGSAAGADVHINGRVGSQGTRGSVLVFAFTGTPDPASLAEAEPASVGVVGADGEFNLTLPPAETVTLAFLADGSSDGVIDGGDPVVVLSDARLTGLQAGDVARLTDVGLDFHTRQAIASIEVQHAGTAPEPTRTATAVPAS